MDATSFAEYVRIMDAREHNEPREGMKSRWSISYKRSIDCSRPRGFSQRNYCARKKRGGAYKT